MEVMRKSPWSIDVEDFKERKLYGVRLLNGKVMFINGVASPSEEESEKPTQEWMLIGITYDVAKAELVERIEHVNEPRDMEAVSFDEIDDKVLFAFDAGED